MFRQASILRSKSRLARGFTLVEMLIVAALIALFAGLAMYNIQTQLTLNKQKAMVAECRQIASAMAFAYQDLSFYPRIGLLRFNLPILNKELKGLGYDSVEYHGNAVGGLDARLQKQWKGIYLAFNFDRVVKMNYRSGSGSKQLDWPADPWEMPYVAYLVHTVPATQSGVDPTERFLTNSGEKADYFAGIISYGPNRVPGLGDNASPAQVQARKPLRLFKDAGWHAYDSLTPSEYTNAMADMIRVDLTPDPANPRIREQGSDDLVLEF